MIFTECVKCCEPIFYGYEAGDKPCGKGAYGVVECPNCKQHNAIERVSFGGETIAEEDLPKGGKITTPKVKEGK